MSNFYPIRRQDRLLDNERATELLETGEYGFLSLGTSENGYAYGIPINFVHDKNRKAVYFHCAPEGHKLDNLQKNNKISFCIVGKTQPVADKFTTLYESVIVFGTADLNLSEEEKTDSLRQLVKKYSPDFAEKGEKYIKASFHRTFVFKLNIEHLTAKSK